MIVKLAHKRRQKTYQLKVNFTNCAHRVIPSLIHFKTIYSTKKKQDYETKKIEKNTELNWVQFIFASHSFKCSDQVIMVF